VRHGQQQRHHGGGGGIRLVDFPPGARVGAVLHIQGVEYHFLKRNHVIHTVMKDNLSLIGPDQ
jgi:hypothetical protein